MIGAPPRLQGLRPGARGSVQTVLAAVESASLRRLKCSSRKPFEGCAEVYLNRYGHRRVRVQVVGQLPEPTEHVISVNAPWYGVLMERRYAISPLTGGRFRIQH